MEVIFSKLPFYTLPSCRIVCKEWNDLILTPKFDPQISISNRLFAYINPRGNLDCLDFDSKHLVKRSNFHKLFPENRIVTVLSSCHELLFLLIKKYSNHYCACILNPLTNEFVMPRISKADRFNYYFYGLGFSPRTKRYKVVRISRILDDSVTMIEIFAFGTSSEWTRVTSVRRGVYFRKYAYFNGELYFLGSYRNGDCVIFCLDVEEERIRKIPTPQVKEKFCRIGNVGGTLYLSTSHDPPFHVWKMIEDSSWIKVFDCSVPNLKLIQICEDGKILFVVNRLYFAFYDPTSALIEVLGDLDIQSMEMFGVHQIGSFNNFSSIHKILAGNG